MRRNHAFTLVELLATAVLAAALMLTVLLVVGSLGRERGAAQRGTAEVPPELMEVVRWDLVNAREMHVARGRVTLSGFGSLRADSLAPRSHRAAEVVYEVRRAGDRSWLVRRQREDGEAGGTFVEPICADVARFALTPLESAEAARPPATGPSSRPASRPSVTPTIAACVRMQVVWDDPKRHPIDQVLVLR